jgi:hypothetical protein
LLSEPRLLDPWVHIVPTINGLVLFNLVETGTGQDLGRAATGAAVTGKIDADGN